MDNPEIKVTTPFGDVRVVVLDAIAEKASLKHEHDVPRLCYIDAPTLRINRIAVKVSGSIEIRTRYREVDGVDVPSLYANPRHRTGTLAGWTQRAIRTSLATSLAVPARSSTTIFLT
jgi:hypothetical protein